MRAHDSGGRVVLTGGPTVEQVRLLDAGETDLALLRGPVTLPSGLSQQPAAHEELGVLMAAENPLAALDAVDAAALTGRELILFPPELSPGFHDEVLRTLRERGADVVLSDSAMGFQQVLAILPLRPAAISLGSARDAGTPGLAWRPFRGTPLNEKVVIIGGSSGIGLAAADAMLGLGADVTLAARSADRLFSAERTLVSRHLSATLRVAVADVAREDDMARLFKETGPVDHLILTAADATGAYQRIKDFDLTAGRP